MPGMKPFTLFINYFFIHILITLKHNFFIEKYTQYSNNNYRITLWGNSAITLNEVLQDVTEMPITIVITSLNVKEFRGTHIVLIKYLKL